MPLDIASIKKDERTFTHDFVISRSPGVDGLDGVENFEPIIITYRPSAMTPELDQKIVDSQFDPKKGNTMWEAEALSTLLISWDVIEGTDPVPTTVDALQKLPGLLLLDCILAIVRDLGKARADLKTG